LDDFESQHALLCLNGKRHNNRLHVVNSCEIPTHRPRKPKQTDVGYDGSRDR